MGKIDLGYKNSLRQFPDVNGDGKADYCREVGNPPSTFIECLISTDTALDHANGKYRISDKGYHDSIRQFADVNGDGKADYCREVGNRPHSFISCSLSSNAGFQEEYGNRINDKGYSDSIRQFADVDGDRKADFCREVGNPPDTFISCTSNTDKGFQEYGYRIHDKGYANSIRQFADVNGDGKADYCREVGNPPHTFVACALDIANGGPAYGHTIQDKGYDNSLRRFADVNGDGKADYCREVGNPPNTFIACALGTDKNIEEYGYIIRDKGYGDSVRHFVDINGDGKIDYCREVGNRPDSYVSCALGTDHGFEEYGLNLETNANWDL